MTSHRQTAPATKQPSGPEGSTKASIPFARWRSCIEPMKNAPLCGAFAEPSPELQPEAVAVAQRRSACFTSSGCRPLLAALVLLDEVRLFAQPATGAGS
jgi:hypothetical protein